MMALTLTNFRPMGFAAAAETIHVREDGTIAAESSADADVIDCKGRWLSPGWCDLHVHVWHGGTDISIRPGQAGRGSGVTAMADAGSAGEATFHGLREYVIDPAAETIKAFINIGSIGLVACNRVPELIDMRSIDVDRTLAVIEAHRDVICGVKVRASGVIVGAWGITPVKIAKRVAEISGLPLMVHVGEPPPLIDEVFDLLSPGDIVTHCFNGKRAGSLADTDSLWAQAKRLAAEGIRMDVGHGSASFSFDVARRAIADGLEPWSISTDLHLHSLPGPVFDLALTASKLLALGLRLETCIDAIAARPRSILGLPGANALTPGSRADFTVFELIASSFEATDSLGANLKLHQVLSPKMTILGTSVAAASGYA